MARSGQATGGLTYEAHAAAGADEGGPGKLLPPSLPRQRRTGMLALAVLLIGLGALLAVYLVLSLSQRVSAVIMVRDVPSGTPLTAADVGTAMVSVPANVQTIPGSQIGSVPGRIAATTLRAGTLLTASELTGVQTPATGYQIVPVALAPSLMPARGLAPGDSVLAVVTAGSSTTQGQAQPGPSGQPSASTDILAVVDRVGSAGPDGRVVVDLQVPDAQAPTLARLAASGRIILDLTPRSS